MKTFGKKMRNHLIKIKVPSKEYICISNISILMCTVRIYIPT